MGETSIFSHTYNTHTHNHLLFLFLFLLPPTPTPSSGLGLSSSAAAVQVDVRSSSDCKNLVLRADEFAAEVAAGAAASATTKPVASILVNMAGITKDNWISKISEADWNDVIDVNLKGPFLMSKHFCEPSRIADPQSFPSGSIINVSSIVAKYGNLVSNTN